MRITCTLSFFLLGCATYTDQTARVRELVLCGETQEAISHLEESSLAGRKKDEVLFRMERGMLHYLSENYDKASKDWERSFYKSEELYTLSLSKTAASVTVSEDLTDYEGEDHERVLVPIFSALSFTKRVLRVSSFSRASRTRRTFVSTTSRLSCANS